MLDGDIQVFDNLGFGGHGDDEFIVDFIGIDIVDPDPVDSVDPAQLPQKLGQLPPVAGQVRAVAAGILGDKW